MRQHDVAVLGLTELTPEAVSGLAAAGLGTLLPHSMLRPGELAHGNGLYSRFPLREGTWVDGVHAGAGATMDVGGRPVLVRVVHPFRTSRFTAAAYRADYRRLQEHLDGLDHAVPALVLGDFNASRDHSAFRRLLGDRWRDAPEVAGAGFVRTWSPRYRIPALMQLDHILVSADFGVRDVDTLRLPESDHRGLVAALVLAGPDE